MLKNFQRYFRFYLATFLFSILLVGIRWQAAPLGAAELTEDAKSNDKQEVIQPHSVIGEVAVR
jgi:hypothetical protein